MPLSVAGGSTGDAGDARDETAGQLCDCLQLTGGCVQTLLKHWMLPVRLGSFTQHSSTLAHGCPTTLHLQRRGSSEYIAGAIDINTCSKQALAAHQHSGSSPVPVSLPQLLPSSICNWLAHAQTSACLG